MPLGANSYASEEDSSASPKSDADDENGSAKADSDRSDQIVLRQVNKTGFSLSQQFDPGRLLSAWLNIELHIGLPR